MSVICTRLIIIHKHRISLVSTTDMVSESVQPMILRSISSELLTHKIKTPNIKKKSTSIKMYKIITCIQCFSNAFHILAYCSSRYMHACLGKDSKILAKIGNLYFLIAILNCRKKMSQIASTFKSQESHA